LVTPAVGDPCLVGAWQPADRASSLALAHRLEGVGAVDDGQGTPKQRYARHYGQGARTKFVALVACWSTTRQAWAGALQTGDRSTANVLTYGPSLASPKWKLMEPPSPTEPPLELVLAAQDAHAACRSVAMLATTPEAVRAVLLEFGARPRLPGGAALETGASAGWVGGGGDRACVPRGDVRAHRPSRLRASRVRACAAVPCSPRP
jgi:hypothetical protein